MLCQGLRAPRLSRTPTAQPLKSTQLDIRRRTSRRWRAAGLEAATRSRRNSNRKYARRDWLGRGCTKIRIPHTYVPPPLPPRRGEFFFFCIQFFLFSNALPALYNASYASNTCQIPTKRPRGEHLRATEGSSAWLHLTVDDVGTEVKHRFVIKQLN